MTIKKEKNLTDDVLTRMSEAKLGLFLDFDGTLSAIVDDPDAASLFGNNGDLLAELSQYVPVTIVSGRSVGDLQKKLGIDALGYVGNHGMEILKNGTVIVPKAAEGFVSKVKDAYDQLSTQIDDPAIFLENKKITLSVHYRNAKNPMVAHEALLPLIKTVAAKNELAIFEGRMVFELRPPVRIDKGSAFTELVKADGLEAAIMIGDDVTDMHAFHAAKRLREKGACDAISLAVKEKETADDVLASADYLLDGVVGVNQFLSSLASKVSASST